MRNVASYTEGRIIDVSALTTAYIYGEVTRWRYWYIGLAIHRPRVQVLAGHHRIVALGKLLTPGPVSYTHLTLPTILRV